MGSRAEFKAELGLGCSLRGAGLVGVTRFAVLPVSSVPSQALRGTQEDITAAPKVRLTENTCISHHTLAALVRSPVVSSAAASLVTPQHSG